MVADLMQYLRKMNQFESEKEARLRFVLDAGSLLIFPY